MIIVKIHEGRIFKTVRKHKTNKIQKIVAFGFEVIFVCEESSKFKSFSDFIGKSESNNKIPLTVVQGSKIFAKSKNVMFDEFCIAENKNKF